MRRMLIGLLAASAMTGCARDDDTSAAAEVAAPGAASVASDGGFHEVELETTLQPAGEYLKIARLGHEICNTARTSQGLAPTLFPSVPDPYVFEQVWTVSNGQDYVIRERRFMVEPVDEEACRWENVWRDHIAIYRSGKLIDISSSSLSAAEVDANAFVSPWRLDNPRDYPLQVDVFGMKLRCATPESLRAANILRPMIGMNEMCIAEHPAVFRNFHGESLMLQARLDGEFFGGRGGKFTGQTRVLKAGSAAVSEATWDPETYIEN
jgi:hypothetical protein